MNSSNPRSHRSARFRRWIFATATLATAILFSGCAVNASGEVQEDGGHTSSATGTTYPLTIDNCGTTVTFESAPRHVVTIKSTSTEMLLALGLGDRIVGSAFSDGDVSESWASSARSVPVLAEKLPSHEATLELEPDLVYAGWESNLSAEGAGDRSTLAALDVSSYVSPAACKDDAYRPNPLTFDALFAEIEQLGEIFDASSAAAQLVSSQRAELSSVAPAGDGRSVLWFSSGGDTPYVGAGLGAPQLVMSAIGLTNIAADVQDSWAPLGWEAIISANPDVIVLVDAPWNTAATKIALLEDNPATARLDAVITGNYLVLPFPAGEAGVRSVEAVVTLNTQLENLDG